MISALLKPSVVINGKKYKIMKQIGEGGFAFVYDVLGTGKESGDHFALKKMICQTEEQLDEAKKEIETMLRLKNSNILELIDHAYTMNKKNQKEALLLLPLFQGSAQTIIDHGQGYPYCGFSSGPDVLKILRHIVEGLKVIHAAGLRHADLKPANILLTSSFDAVITDFGSVSPIPLVIHSRAEALSAQDKAASCTTASYRAPELYNTPSSCVLGGESDVWSLGCLMYCLFYSRSPFETSVEGLSTLSIISAHYQIPENNIWPAEYLEVMASCLQADPTKRASLATLQEKLQSLPSPPLSTQPVGNLSPHSLGSPSHMTPMGASAVTTAATTAAHAGHAGHHNHHAEAKAQVKLASSTSTTSSAVSSSHLEFSEASSYPNTPTSPSMANFADFPDPAAGSTANAALDQAVAVEESYVLSHLTDEQAASVEFASGSALSEMVLEDSSSGHSDLRHRQGSHSSITFSLGHPAGSISTASVNNGSAYGSVHGSAYGSATNGSIADSYVHAEETLSHCSSGSGQNSPMFVPHVDGSASVLNLPSAPVPVRRGLSTPTTHNSQCSFDFVESSHVDFSSSAGNSTNVSPRTLVSAEDAAVLDTASSAPAAGALNGSNSHANSFISHTAAAPGIAETIEESNGWESDEEFGDFTTSTITATAASTTFTPNNTASSVLTYTNTAANTKRPEEESNPRLPLQEVDLWKLITEQAQPTTDQGGNHSHSQAGNTSSRYTIKEGPVYMMRQGGFPKRWAKKQVCVI